MVIVVRALNLWLLCCCCFTNTTTIVKPWLILVSSNTTFLSNMYLRLDVIACSCFVLFFLTNSFVCVINVWQADCAAQAFLPAAGVWVCCILCVLSCETVTALCVCSCVFQEWLYLRFFQPAVRGWDKPSIVVNGVVCLNEQKQAAH